MYRILFLILKKQIRNMFLIWGKDLQIFHRGYKFHDMIVLFLKKNVLFATYKIGT